MNRFRQAFASDRVVLPVIHVADEEQALRNTRVAREAGADGVFLINHGMTDEQLLQIHESVADAFPGWWIGVNCLGLNPEKVFERVSLRVSGVWVDNAMIREDQEAQPAAERLLAIRRKRGWPGLYFGGVAFKYQRPVSDLVAAARIASRYMDVVTTSGPGTGRAATPEKIRLMKGAMDELPLAIASGVIPENVGDYQSWADCFLVATGISRSFEEFEPERVQALVKRVRAFRPPEGACPSAEPCAKKST